MRERTRLRLVRGQAGNVGHIYPTFVSYVVAMPDGTTVEGNAVLPLQCVITEPGHIGMIQAVLQSGVKATDRESGAAIVGGAQPRVFLRWWKALRPIMVRQGSEEPAVPKDTPEDAGLGPATPYGAA